MINKYNNPRLHNTVLTGPGMAHPRNPHVVIGSDEQGFIQGDLMDANAIMETIDQKIDVDNLLDQEKINEAVQNAVSSIDVPNSFTTVKVGTTNLVADNKSDTLTITAGNNITLTPNAAQDSFSISAATSQSDWQQNTSSANDYIKNKPTVVDLNRIKVGDYLYNDLTWGTSSTNAIAICVNDGTNYNDGFARFASLTPSQDTYIYYNGSKECYVGKTNGIEDGYVTTQYYKDHYTISSFPAMQACVQAFNNMGYMPSINELIIALRIIYYTSGRSNSTYSCWSSTQFDNYDQYPSTVSKYTYSTSYPGWSWSHSLKTSELKVLPFIKIAQPGQNNIAMPPKGLEYTSICNIYRLHDQITTENSINGVLKRIHDNNELRVSGRKYFIPANALYDTTGLFPQSSAGDGIGVFLEILRDTGESYNSMSAIFRYIDGDGTCYIGSAIYENNAYSIHWNSNA